jgi:cytochrome c peroxidase
LQRSRSVFSCSLVLLAGMALVLAFGGQMDEQKAFPPLGPLPPVAVPPDHPQTPAKIELGKLLFFDPRLSGDSTTSCASCHAPKLGWGDGGDLSRGYPATLHWRNSQTILNVAYSNKWFWTGSSSTLEAQAKAAMTGALAQNMNPALAEERLKQIPDYVRLFKEAFGEPPSFDRALDAIAAFERTIVSKNVPFDRYMQGDKTALTAQQIAGLELFQGKAGCIQCHHGPMLTDEDFHNLRVPKHPDFETEPLRQIAMRERMNSKGIPEAVYITFDRDPGRYLDTKKDEDKDKFRTPPLRELIYTSPYMHNGVFKTLDEVIALYNQGGGEDPFGSKSSLLKPLALSAEEQAALRALLESLSGDEILLEPPTLPPYGILPLPQPSQPGAP